LGFCKFQEGYVGLAFWILFAFLFAVEASLGGMDDDNWDWRMLETVSKLVWLRDREEVVRCTLTWILGGDRLLRRLGREFPLSRNRGSIFRSD
jgi:hypothetical protein